MAPQIERKRYFSVNKMLKSKFFRKNFFILPAAVARFRQKFCQKSWFRRPLLPRRAFAFRAAMPNPPRQLRRQAATLSPFPTAVPEGLFRPSAFRQLCLIIKIPL
ncbi:hypothetical protein [uncultured Mailhella sp.]|uniref:hypothetical protein n=1 Tax=uncultured Mailhella sp. TaxID=1981031 RepID=UPI0025FEE2DF|nr:hypothetical protein [uncultured Mailhella sp.]